MARVRARYATLLRRLGLYPEAEAAIRRALEEALDPFTRARVESEAGILQAAQGRPLEALALLSRAEAYFRTTGRGLRKPATATSAPSSAWRRPTSSWRPAPLTARPFSGA